MGQALQYFGYVTCIYDLSLLISFRAFLPSLRVIKTSQEREEMIIRVSVIREISVVLKL